MPERTTAPTARNALRHGLYAPPDVAVHDEQPGDWAAFHQAVLADLAPEGVVERALASRIALALWRLRRVPVAEVMAIQRKAEEDVRDEEDHREFIRSWRAALRPGGFYHKRLPEPPDTPVVPPPAVLPPDKALETISRYEAHLNRQLVKSLHELQALQDRRNGRPAPLARLDVDISSGDAGRVAPGAAVIAAEPVDLSRGHENRGNKPADRTALLPPPPENAKSDETESAARSRIQVAPADRGKTEETTTCPPGPLPPPWRPPDQKTEETRPPFAGATQPALDENRKSEETSRTDNANARTPDGAAES